MYKKCNQCGAVYETEDQFCMNCGYALVPDSDYAPVGAAVPAAAVPPAVGAVVPAKPAGKGKAKIIIAVCAAAVLIVGVVLLILFASGGSKYVYAENIYSFYRTEDDKGVLLCNMKNICSIDLEDDVYSSTMIFPDGKSMFFEYDGFLYYTDGSRMNKVASDVKKIITVSMNGAAGVFSDSDGAVYYCELPSCKTKMVVNDSDRELYCAALSEDGSCLAYTMYDRRSNDYRAYLFTNGKSADLGEKNMIPISISNDGRSYYGLKPIDWDMTLYGVKRGEKSKIAAGAQGICFNKSGSQISFCSNGSTYICADYEEKIKISSYTVYPMLPDGSARCARSYFNYSMSSLGYYPITSFADGFFTGDNNEIVYVNGKFESSKVASGAWGSRLSRDGRIVYYRNSNGALYRISASDLENKTKISSNVDSYGFSPDGKTAYILKDDTLMRYIGEDGDKICDDVYDFYVTASGDVFILSNYSRSGYDLLFYKGGKPEKVRSDVFYLYIGGDYAAFSENYDDGVFDLYRRTSGKSFELQEKEVTGFAFYN